MYEYKRRPSKLKRVFVSILLILIVAAISIFIYDMYADINVYSSEQTNENLEISRVSYTEKTDSGDDITKTLEDTIKCVVGISKIKNTGNSIFLNNSTESLGLGTGIIVSKNGYILTNWHVAGEKYSNCYITL